MPPNTLKVDRTTIWGNPYTVGMRAPGWMAPVKTLETVEQCVQAFTRMIVESRGEKEIRANLRGRNLGCWCPVGSRCHADVLLLVANR